MTEQTKVELSNEAAKLIADLREMLEAGGRFVLEQAPPLAREIVAYGRAIETTCFVGGLLVAIVSLVWLSLRVKAWIKWSNEADCPHIGFFVTILPSIVGTIMWLINTADFLKVWFAPRLYLIEYVGWLLK